jgi:VCBS repeat-containing protein
MLTFSITIVEDPGSGLSYLYFWGNSNTVAALGGYTLRFNLSYLVDGQWSAIVPTAIQSLSAWDLFDTNLASSTVSAVSAEGLRLSAETNSIGLFRVLLPESVNASSDLLAWINEFGGDLIFDQNGDSIGISPSLQQWDSSLPGAQFVEIHTPTMITPAAASYTDTSADDSSSDTTGTLVAFDSDGDILTYGIIGGTVSGRVSSKAGTYGTLTVDTVTGSYVYTPNDSTIEGLKQDTSESFVVIVSNGFSIGESSFVVNLVGADDITTFSGALTASVAEDGVPVASGTLNVADRDVGDSLIIEQNNTTGTYGTFSIGTAGHWNYTLSKDAAVVQSLKGGQSVTDSFSVVTVGGGHLMIGVNVSGANDVPTLVNPIPDLVVSQDAAFNYTFTGTTFRDVDFGNLFTYAATLSEEVTLPSWLSFDEGTRTFTGTPANADVGSYDIVLMAHDSSNLTVTDTFRITVNNVDDEATGTLSVTGTAAEGEMLTASLGNVMDFDGATTIAWQWQVSDEDRKLWSDIVGATNASFTIASDQSQVGKYLRVVAATIDAQGGATIFTGDASSQIANVNDAPTGTVTVSGTATQGQMLTASNNLEDVDGIPTMGNGAIKYQWNAGGVAISGATANTYILTQAEVSKAITVTATYTDLQGTAESVTTSATSAVVNAADITGHVYHWKSHVLMQGVQMADGAITATTDANGSYHFKASDSSLVLPEPTLAVGNIGNAIDAVDALAALKIAAGRNPNADGSPVTPYQFIAADMNEDGVVTSADALAILKLSLNRQDAPAAKWLFVNESEDFWNEAINSFATSRKSATYDKSIELNPKADININLVAVLKGDVDGSWAAPTDSFNVKSLMLDYFATLSQQLNTPQSQWGVL